MPNSQVNDRFDFNQEKWVVSLIKTGGLLGHAVIVVEGVKDDGRIFPDFDTKTHNYMKNIKFVV